MKSFTDLFIRRPVLGLVVNLVILIAGFQSIKSLNVRQYPRSDNATVTITTVYVGAQPQPGPGAGCAGRQQFSLRRRSDQRLAGAGEPHGQYRPALGRGISQPRRPSVGRPARPVARHRRSPWWRSMPRSACRAVLPGRCFANSPLPWPARCSFPASLPSRFPRTCPPSCSMPDARSTAWPAGSTAVSIVSVEPMAGSLTPRSRRDRRFTSSGWF